ncbi:hypothetical protein ACPOL_0134 [Acidisarcina polymorpha]|uniref:Flagellar FliJ protein n=1 Tax=Acidisarcina polymorpha TaxID=2211140 RepID=A0A2Z5FS13_9BACT|nr:hypothetical protein [Acidisarcina polymorpha]AXC09519.1 hypothetical protein ACPOL_0134 [Acidisarcina polymorpha]
MIKALKRVLRVRALEEEQCRLELDEAATSLRLLEQASIQAKLDGRESRERSFKNLEEADGRQEEISAGCSSQLGRLIEEACWLRSTEQRRLLEAKRVGLELQRAMVEERFLVRRRERMQVETLVKSALAIERAQQDRDQQRHLDDWFQSRPKEILQKGGDRKRR